MSREVGEGGESQRKKSSLRGKDSNLALEEVSLFIAHSSPSLSLSLSLQLGAAVLQLAQTVSPLVSQAQELTFLVSEHVHKLNTLIIETGDCPSSTVSKSAK